MEDRIMKKLMIFVIMLGFIGVVTSYAQKIEGQTKPGTIKIGSPRGDETKVDKNYFKSSIQRWAVVVGISQFKYTSKGITPLRYADADARSFYEFLKSPQGGAFPTSNMKLLLNKEATLANITEAINVFLAKAIEDDIVIIYFAGHGAPDPNNVKNMFLLTYDTDPSKMASSGYLMDDMKRAMERFIKARNVLVFTDACHSAGVTGEYATRGKQDDAIVNRYLINLAQSDNSTLIFTASEAAETSQESKNWGGGHGIFTWSMLEGMKGDADENKDGIITIGELIDYTQQKVKRETNSQQHPDKSSSKFDRNLPISVIKPELWR
jgi:uncharacterized caspase-like protein